MVGKLFANVIALIFTSISAASAVAKPSEAEFCSGGMFFVGDVRGGMLDLALDLPEYMGKKIVIISHMVLEYSDKENERHAYLAELNHCFYSSDKPYVILKRSEKIPVRISRGVFDNTQWRSIRKMLAQHTSKLRAEHHFVIEGTVKLFGDTLAPYIHVEDLYLYGYS